MDEEEDYVTSWRKGGEKKKERKEKEEEEEEEAEWKRLERFLLFDVMILVECDERGWENISSARQFYLAPFLSRNSLLYLIFSLLWNMSSI